MRRKEKRMEQINNVQDFNLRYKVKLYNKIQNDHDISINEFNNLHLLLSILGLNSKKKVSLDTKNGEDSRSFSTRTTYRTKASDFDTNFGLIAVLDNLEKNYDEVVNHVAFEKTYINNKSFYKMTNVETFYQYMLSGLDFYEKEFLKYGNSIIDIVDAIHEFLEKDLEYLKNDITELLYENFSDED